MRKILSLAIASFWMFSLVAQNNALSDTKIQNWQKKEKLSEQEFLNLSEKERDALGIPSIYEQSKSSGAKDWLFGFTFAQASGTYTPITGGTVQYSGSFDDYVATAIPIGFTFNFDGTDYTEVAISTNGYLIIGGTTNLGYNPISSSTAAAGCIAPMGRDLQNAASGTPEIRYETIGTAPNRTFVVQWQDVKRYGSSYSNEVLNFQVQIFETTNLISMVYGPWTPTTGTGTTYPQVGIRGSSNLDYYNRESATDWSSTTAGATNLATITLNQTVGPPSGLTFTYSPILPTAIDGGIAEVIVDGNICNGTRDIIATLKNYGSTSLTACDINYTIDGGAVQTYAWTGSLALFQEEDVTIASGINLGTPGSHPIVAYTNLTGDTTHTNDTATTTAFYVEQIASFPFLEDFETSNDYLNLWDTTYSSVDIAADASYGSNALLFTGGNSSTGWTGGSTSATYTNAWVNNVRHHAKAYTCDVDATTANPSNFYLTFDLRQTYSYGPNYSWFRVMLYGSDTVELVDINGDSNFLPQQVIEDAYKKIYMDLSAYAGQSFVLSFQSSCKYNEAYSAPGDNSFLDNIFMGELPTNDIAVAAYDDTVALANNDSVYPQARLINNGLNNQYDVNVTLTIGTYTSTISVDTLFALSEVNVNFDTTIATIGVYTATLDAPLAGDENPTDNTDEFIVNVSKWSAGLPDIADGSYMGSSAYLQNDTARLLYAFGGNRESGNKAAFNVLNVNTGTWYDLTDAPSASVVGAATVLQNKVLAHIGYDGSAYSDAVYFYDIASDNWTDTALLPAPLAWTSMTTVGSNAYLAGGNDGSFAVASVYRFDGTAWTTASEMPGARFGGSLINVGGKLVYVQGADDATINTTVFIGTIDGSSADTIVWVESSACPVGVFKMTAVALNDHALMFTGGNDGAGGSYWHALPNTWIYDLTTDTWTEKDAKPQPVLGYFAGAYNYGPDTVRYVVASGYDNNTVGQNLNVEYYDYINYGVTFNVTDGTNPLENVTININGTDITTNASGVATINLPDGAYPYTATLAGYYDTTGTITVNGASITEDIVMTELPPNVYTVTFNITDGTNPLENVDIEINSTTITTNASGVATIDLIDGAYPYTATLAGYDDVTGTVTVAGAAVTEDVTMDLTVIYYTVEFGVENGVGGSVVAELGSVGGTPITSGDLVAAGSDIYFTATPDANYHVADWLYNGASTGLTVTSVVEEGLAGNITVYVVFAPDGINETEGNAVQLYPNPTNGLFFIEIEGEYDVKVMNVNGEVVYNGKFVDKGEINLSNQAAGVYMIQLSNNKQIINHRIMVK